MSTSWRKRERLSSRNERYATFSSENVSANLNPCFLDLDLRSNWRFYTNFRDSRPLMGRRLDHFKEQLTVCASSIVLAPFFWYNLLNIIHTPIPTFALLVYFCYVFTKFCFHPMILSHDKNIHEVIPWFFDYSPDYLPILLKFWLDAR